MTIYDEVNAQLEDKTLDVAQIAAIGKSSEFGIEDLPLGDGRHVRVFTAFVRMDDGSMQGISRHDYEVLESNLEEIVSYWRYTVTFKEWMQEVVRIFIDKRGELFRSYDFDWAKAHEDGLSPAEAVEAAVFNDWFGNVTAI